MCGWEEGAQNGIWREAEGVDGKKEHKMGFGGRPLDVWVGGGSTKGGGGHGGRIGAGMGEGKRVGEYRRQNVSLLVGRTGNGRVGGR